MKEDNEQQAAERKTLLRRKKTWIAWYTLSLSSQNYYHYKGIVFLVEGLLSLSSLFFSLFCSERFSS